MHDPYPKRGAMTAPFRTRHRKPLTFLAGGITAVVFAVVIAIAAVSVIAAFKSTKREVIATVTHRERVCSHAWGETQQKCQYLVFTDKDTFKIVDTWTEHDSSDMYGKFREDHTYRFEVRGYRSGVWSEYPRVVTEPVEVQR